MSIEDFVNQILSKMPNDLNVIEKARYIYIELGKIKSYNDDYYFATINKRKKIYKDEYCEDIVSADELMQKDKLICVGIARLYGEILKKFNIATRLHKEGNEELCHLYNSIITENGEVYKADLEKDIKYIQMGMKTSYFGKCQYEDFDELSDATIKRIDKKIGYIKDDYNDKHIFDLIKVNEGESVNQTVKRILTDEKFNELLDTVGYMELIGLAKRFTNYLQILLKTKTDIITAYYCYTVNSNNGKVKDSICIYVGAGNLDERFFLFKKRCHRFVPITDAEFRRLKSQGLVIVNKDKYMEYRIKNEAKLKAKRNVVNADVDPDER